MAQRIFIAKPTNQLKYVIGDDDLWIYEFQEFFRMLKHKFDFAVDGYSGAILNLDKNREIAQLIVTKIYQIEDSFPTVKQSVFNKKKQISKAASIQWSQKLVESMDFQSTTFSFYKFYILRRWEKDKDVEVIQLAG